MRTLTKDTVGLVGSEVTVQGWVQTRRDHGKIVFLDVRDRSGLVQVVAITQALAESVTAELPKISTECVVELTGLVKARPEKLINPKLTTGTVEIELKTITVLSTAKELPIHVEGDGLDINEEHRLRYRYLDLRRERMNKIVRLRSDYFHALRKGLVSRDFTEVETPVLAKATMEGARDFLVPSRFQPGKFYALPQSPQQYKQLLMVAGLERYFQFPHCFRDEDLRADRGFEFTQLDLEMSFVNRDEVMQTVEDVVTESVAEVGGKLKDEVFPVLTYAEAMKKFGADRFDLRSEEDKKMGKLAFAWVVDFPFFKKVNTQDAAELRDGKSGWTFTHNPFSAPKPEHKDWHTQGKNVEQILTSQYDLVCNGYEVGGGSIRAHEPAVLEATYRIMGYSQDEIQASIGHMLEAFSFGAPPHGGIALGLDRLIMLLAQETSLKEAIAFPMTSTGRTAVMDGPSPVTEEQLKELGIAVTGTKKK